MIQCVVTQNLREIKPRVLAVQWLLGWKVVSGEECGIRKPFRLQQQRGAVPWATAASVVGVTSTALAAWSASHCASPAFGNVVPSHRVAELSRAKY